MSIRKKNSDRPEEDLLQPYSLRQLGELEEVLVSLAPGKDVTAHLAQIEEAASWHSLFGDEGVPPTREQRSEYKSLIEATKDSSSELLSSLQRLSRNALVPEGALDAVIAAVEGLANWSEREWSLVAAKISKSRRPRKDTRHDLLQVLGDVFVSLTGKEPTEKTIRPLVRAAFGPIDRDVFTYESSWIKQLKSDRKKPRP